MSKATVAHFEPGVVRVVSMDAARQFWDAEMAMPQTQQRKKRRRDAPLVPMFCFCCGYGSALCFPVGWLDA